MIYLGQIWLSFSFLNAISTNTSAPQSNEHQTGLNILIIIKLKVTLQNFEYTFNTYTFNTFRWSHEVFISNFRSTNRTSVKGHSTFSNMKSNSANEKETQNFLNHHLHQHHHHHHHHHHNHQNNYHHDYHHDSHHHHGQQRGVDLVFKNISVSVTTKLPGSLASFDKITQEKLILHDISGYAKPGQILSVMGPSGSGKTTLLSALGGRLKPTCGCITLNGETLNKQIKRKIGYVLQQDIFFTGLTLRQTLMVINK